MRMCQRWCILLFVCIIEMFVQPEQTLKNFYCCPVKCVLLPMLLKFCIENKRAIFLVFAPRQRFCRMRNGAERRGST